MTCLDDEGMAEIATLMDYYLENARILKEVWSGANRILILCAWLCSCVRVLRVVSFFHGDVAVLYTCE